MPLFDLSNLPYWILLGMGVLLFLFVIVSGGGDDDLDVDADIDADLDADLDIDADFTACHRPEPLGFSGMDAERVGGWSVGRSIG
jgi:hypothetical protein